MTIRDRIRDWLGVDERAITPAQLYNTGQWTDLAGTASGQAVTATTVMQAAQGACVRLLADDISSLPADTFVKDGRSTVAVPQPEWLTTPTGRPGEMFMSYLSDWVTSIGTNGHAFTLVLPNVFDPQWLEVMDPEVTEIIEEQSDNGKIIRYRTEGGKLLDATQVLSVPWVRLPGTMRGINPVQAGRESVGLELAAQKWAAAFFKNGGSLGGLISVPGGPETVDADKLREQFEARHQGERNWWKPAVMTGGATYETDTITPQQAELDPLWDRVLEAAMRVYHIPPHLMSVIDTGAAARASVEERGIGYTRHAVRPFAVRFERSHSLLLPGSQFVKLNLNALMRGDAKTRGEYYNLMLQGKSITRDEVRDLEDLPFLGELGWLETPNNNGTAEPAAEPEPRSEPMSVVVNNDRAESTPSEVRVESAPQFHFDTLTVHDEVAQRLVMEEGGKVREMMEAMKAKHQAELMSMVDIMERMDAESAERIRAVQDVQEQQAEEYTKRLAELSEPITRSMTYDDDGIATGYIERQGVRTWRVKAVRDENGRVINTVAA